MRCPYCSSTESRVVDSRPSDDNTAIRRRRECLHCQQRFTTYEQVETVPIMVVKKDGRRERFDPEKIRFGVTRACEKRPVSHEDIVRLVNEVERKVSAQMEDEIPSQQIGEMVMSALKDLDEVAYVRFASVYRQFQDINTFAEELNRLIREKR